MEFSSHLHTYIGSCIGMEMDVQSILTLEVEILLRLCVKLWGTELVKLLLEYLDVCH